MVPRAYVGAYYVDPYWLYDPWFGYGYPYPIGGYPYPYRYYNDPGGSVRVEVKPNNAEVYVDGYYAGIVDDFDGTFQRLRVPPGEHEIALHLDGYRGVRQKVYLRPAHTFRLKSTMEKLPAGEQPEARPQPVNPPQAGAPQPPMYPPQGRGAMGRRGAQGPPQGGPPMERPRGGEAATYGSLAIRVQPADAEILIDGEPWRGSEQNRLIVDVAEGSHTVEIRKAGYRTYTTQVNVRRGETTPVNVSLRAQDES